jgi:hypothetical protein
VTCETGRSADLLALAAAGGVPAELAGTVGAADAPLEIHLRDSHFTFGWPTPELRGIYFDAIPRRMRANGERPAGGG